MITPLVSTNDFKQLVPDPRFTLAPPPKSPFVTNSVASVSADNEGTDLQVADPGEAHSSVAAVRAVGEILKRTRADAQKRPDSARAHANLGLALLNTGDRSGAVAAFEEALRLEPNQYVAAFNLARVWIAEGKLAEAESLYLRLRDAYPLDAAPSLALAHVLVRRDSFSEAALSLRRILSLEPRNTLARYLLAVVLLKLGKAIEAIGQLREASRIDVRSPELHHGLGVAFAVAGDLRRAARSFKTALALAPNMDNAVHGLALVYLVQRRFKLVIDLLLNHIDRRPSDHGAREILARAYAESREYPRARSHLARVLDGLAQSDATLQHRSRLANNIGVCFAFEGNREQAKTWLNESIKLKSERATPYNNLARLYIGEGQLHLALQLLDQARGVFPNARTTRLLQAYCFQECGRVDDAIRELRSLVEEGDAPPRVYADFGRLLAMREDHLDEGLRVMRAGLLKYPGDPSISNNLAYTHLMNGQVKEARAALDGVRGGTEPHVELVATQGLLKLWEEDINGGKELYGKAESMASSEGRRKLARIVRQKMHLEVARAHYRNGDIVAAARQLRAAMHIRDGKDEYCQDIEKLKRELASLESDGNTNTDSEMGRP